MRILLQQCQLTDLLVITASCLLCHIAGGNISTVLYCLQVRLCCCILWHYWLVVSTVWNRHVGWQ